MYLLISRIIFLEVREPLFVWLYTLLHLTVLCWSDLLQMKEDHFIWSHRPLYTAHVREEEAQLLWEGFVWEIGGGSVPNYSFHNHLRFFSWKLAAMLGSVSSCRSWGLTIWCGGSLMICTCTAWAGRTVTHPTYPEVKFNILHTRARFIRRACACFVMYCMRWVLLRQGLWSAADLSYEGLRLPGYHLCRCWGQCVRERALATQVRIQKKGLGGR